MIINTKYSIYDEVWFMFKDKPIKGTINGIQVIKSNNMCSWTNDKTIYVIQIPLQQQTEITDESLLFKTKVDLLASL